MLRQGRLNAWKVFAHRPALLQIGLGRARLLFCGLWLAVFLFSPTPECSAAEKAVRLRLAWGSGTAAKQRWTGKVSIEGGVLTELQPLGIEADAAAALRIDGSQLILAPLEKRGFDGCDVMVRADEQAIVRVEISSEQMPQAAVFEAPLSEVLSNQLGRRLDELDSFFLARRSPGDVLRVSPTRAHYVFNPNEKWTLKLQPDLAQQLAAGPLLLDVQLRATGATKPTWRNTQQITDVSQLEEGVEFEIECPPAEGAYRLTITARPEEGFATRFVPGQQAKLLASRDVEFVVIDPNAKLSTLVDRWLPLLTIDPANPSWWQRLPSWAQVPRFRERNQPAVGNVRPVVRPTPTGDLVELPPAAAESDPSWQSYTLPVREAGQPHLVEIEYPRGAEQHLAITLVEPDAAGKVTQSQQGASLFSEGQFSKGTGTATDSKVAIHRFMIWPRTNSPQLLIVNRHPTKPGQFGKIKLLSQDTSLATLADLPIADASTRLVAGYLAKPLLTQNFGAAESLDPTSGTSVQTWDTFLEGTRRLAQSLRLGGYNGLMITVAADGSALYPSRLLQPSPRYDSGLLAASGQDPIRKDVLEMLLRVFDREGIRVIPTVQLAAPLPRLEVLRLSGDVRATGIGCVGYDGQSWLAENPTAEGLAPFYNPLNDRVQAELVEVVTELTTRYSNHASLTGIGLQLSGEGYGLMPGLAWGLDDQTVGEFLRATGIAMPSQGAQRFRTRANSLLGEHREAWQKWRTERLSQLYARLAKQVTAQRSDLRLLLATEDLFAGPELRQRVRETIARPLGLEEVLRDHAIDFPQLNALPAVTALVPHRLSATSLLQERALDIRVNTSVEQGEMFSTKQHSAELLYQATQSFPLPSFDQRSPFGAEHTFLTVVSQPCLAGNSQRRQLLTALASSDAMTVVAGGWQLPLSVDASTRTLLSTLQQLPGPLASVRSQREQPVVMRIYRTEQATIVTLMNEAPWPVQVEVGMTAMQHCTWQKLGNDDHGSTETLSGTLSESEKKDWQAQLQPYDLQAWRFEDSKLRLGELKTLVTPIAKADLQHRIKEIESRAGNLDVERAYPQLQNPGFELEDGSTRILGWQPRQGALGEITLVDSGSHSGTRALRLRSEDATGVAVQSNLFPTPDTGQLMVSLFLRFDQLEESAQLQIVLQDEHQGRRYRQFATLGNTQMAGKGWQRYEFPLEDVPSDQGEQLRLHLHLTGKAEVLVDDLQLVDLRFDEQRRRALVKRIYAANIALEQGQVVDCLRVVDDYWSQYLVEHVQPRDSVASLATKQAPVTESQPKEEEKGIGSRVRGWVPKIWR